MAPGSGEELLLVRWLASSAVGPLLILLAALLLDGILPPLSGLTRILPNPRQLAAGLGRFLLLRLDRARRSESTRLVRGAVATAAVLALAAWIGWLIEGASLHSGSGLALELVAVTLLLGQRRVFAQGRRVARALARGGPGLPAAREAAGALLGPGWDAGQLDGHGAARVAVEAVAVGFAEQVVGPAFWFALAGLPGMLAAVATNALVPRAPEESRFAMTALRLDDAVEYLPARIAALLLALAAVFAPTGRPLAAFATIRAAARRHPSLNRGWPLAALAGALDLSLAGPRRSAEGKSLPAAWIGEGRARAEWADVHRALYLFAVACLLDAALVGALALLRGALA
jgi:adenosylcobinamide-phosphate synthase